MSAIAAATGVAVVYGYREREGSRVYNAARLVDSEGRAAANYRKTHPCGDVDRRASAYLADRRPDLYSSLAER